MINLSIPHIRVAYTIQPCAYTIQGGPKIGHTFVAYALTSCALTSSNIDRFPNLFHCLNQENFSNNAVTKDPTTPQVCR